MKHNFGGCTQDEFRQIYTCDVNANAFASLVNFVNACLSAILKNRFKCASVHHVSSASFLSPAPFLLISGLDLPVIKKNSRSYGDENSQAGLTIFFIITLSFLYRWRPRGSQSGRGMVKFGKRKFPLGLRVCPPLSIILTLGTGQIKKKTFFWLKNLTPHDKFSSTQYMYIAKNETRFPRISIQF